MKEENRFKQKDVLLISLAHHIHDIYTSFLAPVQIVLRENLGINHTMFGLLAVIQRIPNLMNPYIGILAEKIRIRYLMIVSPTITAVAMSLIGLAPAYTFLAVLMLVSGISSSMFHVPTPVMIKHVAGVKTGRGMSYYMFGGELARTLGPILITGAISLWGFEGIYRLIPMGVIASIILFVRFRHVDLRKDFPREEGEKVYTNAFRQFLPLLVIIVGITFTRGFMKNCLTYYLPGFLEENGESRWFSNISLSAVYLAGTVGTLFSGTISDRIGRKNMLLILGFISPVLMWVFIYFGDQMGLPLLAVMGFFLLAPTPVILSIIHRQKTHHLPFINGLYMTSNFLISSFTTLLTGLAFDHLGDQLTFKLAGAIAFLTIPVVLCYKED